MSSKDFLKRMREAGEKYSGGGGAGVVGRIKVEFGLHRFVAGHDFWSFWKPAATENELESVASELQGRLQQAGSTETPTFGIKVTIDKNVLSRDEPYKADLQEFVPAWQQDSFDMIFNHIEEGDLPVGEWFYGRVQYKANPHFVKQGDAGKTEEDQNGNPRYPTVRVPVEKFANEAAARGAVSGSGSNSNAASANSQWSDKLRANYHDPSDIEKSVEDIHKYYQQIKAGELPFNGAPELPQPATPPKLKQYLATMYDCEPSDIDIILEMTPF